MAIRLSLSTTYKKVLDDGPELFCFQGSGVTIRIFLLPYPKNSDSHTLKH